MRLGVVFEPNSAAFYRAIDPMRVMEERGHTVVWPGTDGRGDARKLSGCDMVHVYRRADAELQQLMRQGMPLTYDNDDDFTNVPRESPDYKKVGGANGIRIHALTVRMAKQARCFTTTNEVLAQRYRDDGVERIEVIPNLVAADVPRPRAGHKGFVIGWVGGVDHRADVARIPIKEALERLQAKYPDVHVECIGVDLSLKERYRHDGFVPFRELPARIGGWDLGIAPLADIPANRVRSDIKIKEYAASGVPWLASPVGPYAGHGEEQGGMLVPDDGWLEALEGMVTMGWWARRGVTGKAAKWGRRSTIDAAADRWVQLFTSAAR